MIDLKQLGREKLPDTLAVHLLFNKVCLTKLQKFSANALD